MSEDTSNQKDYKFSADRPWQPGEEDLLNRYGFAEELAKAIEAWGGKDSLVLGLNGDWGSGKSSVKNMLKEVIKNDELETEILEFEPWEWSGQDAINEAFFEELAITVDDPDLTGGDLGNLSKKIKLFAQKLKIASKATKSLEKIIRFILGVGIIGSIFIYGFSSQPSPVWLFLIVLFALGSMSINALVELFQSIAEMISTKAEVESKELFEIKEDLRKSLSKLEKPVLVIIDDIDRLTPEQTHLIFQLIKANADFPNLIYLMIFQRDTVEKHLDTEGIDGSLFLEKIVQVFFDLPAISEEKIKQVLKSEVMDSIQEHQEHFFGRDGRWRKVYKNGISHYVEDLRGIFRVVSTFDFHNEIFQQDNVSEINPIDLIGLEVLRTYEPDVYETLPGHQKALTGRSIMGWHQTRQNQLEEEIREEIIAKAEDEEVVEEFLKELFPPLERVFGNRGFGPGIKQGWHRARRVCSNYHFSKYFKLSLSEEKISQQRLKDIFDCMDDRDELKSVLYDLAEDELDSELVSRLAPYVSEIPLEYAGEIIQAFYDVGDEIDVDSVTIFISNYLRENDDIDERFSFLSSAIEQTEGIYLPVRQVFNERREQYENSHEERLITQKQYEELSELCLEKFRNGMDLEYPIDNPGHLVFLLNCWEEWGSIDEVNSWVEELIDNEEGLLTFLNECMGISMSTENALYEHETQFDPELIDHYSDVDLINEKISDIDESQLNEADQQIVAIYRTEVM